MKLIQSHGAIGLLGIILISGMISCKERFTPNVQSLEQSFLVVEGNLNAAQDSTVIRLTRSYKLDDTASLKFENNAQLTVEGSDNTTRSLSARGRGYYFSSNLNLTVGTGYRVRIRTTNGKEYLSDYVTARKTPPIDSISWEREDAGLRIFANTKDVTNATRYYRWDFDETWEIHSYYFSFYIYQRPNVRPRIFPAEDVSVCWKYDYSRHIPLANSVHLQNDVIYKAPIMLIENGDDRLSVRYSILVKQYALDKDAYNFFELMKKNTEDIGSIFAPQPSELRGNLHCTTDPDEYVLGYITASSMETKRVFIRVPWNFRQDCPDFTVPDIPDSILFYFGTGSLYPYDFSADPGPHYQASHPDCIDCTLRNGSLVKPSFW